MKESAVAMLGRLAYWRDLKRDDPESYREEVIQHYQRAIENNPEDIEPYVRLGDFYADEIKSPLNAQFVYVAGMERLKTSDLYPADKKTGALGVFPEHIGIKTGSIPEGLEL